MANAGGRPGKDDRQGCRVRPIYRRLSRHSGVCRACSTTQSLAAAVRAPFALAAAPARSLRTLALNEQRHWLVLPRLGSLRSCAMNAARSRFVTLLGAATLATRALGQTGDHVAACYSPSTTVRLSNSENIVLNQNSPNPFAEQTTITYKLPDTVKTAKMLFYDAQGELIKAVNLTSHRSRSNDRDDEIAECAGEGQLFIFADDLRAGLYTYALVVDERKVSSKQMVKSR